MEKTNVPGAQTERRGKAWAGECPSSRLGTHRPLFAQEAIIRRRRHIPTPPAAAPATSSSDDGSGTGATKSKPLGPLRPWPFTNAGLMVAPVVASYSLIELRVSLFQNRWLLSSRAIPQGRSDPRPVI